MLTVFQTHPLIIGAVLALLDLSLWRWLGASRPVSRAVSRGTAEGEALIAPLPKPPPA